MSINKRIVFGSIVIVTVLGLSFFMIYIGFFNNEEIKKPVKTFFNQKNIFLEYTRKNNDYLNKIDFEKADNLIHQELINTFQNIFTGEILNRYSTNIKYCSWFTEDYQIYFSGFDNLKIEKMEVRRTGIDRAVCKVIYKSQESSNLDEYENFNIKNLVKEYKITNFTQDQLDKAKYSNFRLYVQNQDEFSLKRIKNKWYIYKLKYSILNSKLELIKPIITEDVFSENVDIKLIGGIPDESQNSPNPKILSKEKVIGYFVSTEWGDYRHLNFKDLDGKELSFFISTDINMDTLSELEENPELAKKKIELTWYKVDIYIPESGGVNELEVAMHIKLLE